MSGPQSSASPRLCARITEPEQIGASPRKADVPRQPQRYPIEEWLYENASDRLIINWVVSLHFDPQKQSYDRNTF